MKMTMRWFGTGYDPVTLDKLRQVPGLDGIIATLYGVPPGEVWVKEQYRTLKNMDAKSGGLLLPGWEPERMTRIKDLFDVYHGIDEETLFANLVYFLNAIMPVCMRYGIKMALYAPITAE